MQIVSSIKAFLYSIAAAMLAAFFYMQQRKINKQMAQAKYDAEKQAELAKTTVWKLKQLNESKREINRAITRTATSDIVDSMRKKGWIRDK